MKRRGFALGAISFALGRAAQASNVCGGYGCVAEVSFSKFAAKYERQYESEWCWAACISMIFGYYGRPVSQARVVQQAYGEVANVPAISGAVIARSLNRSWIDDDGERFRSSVRAVFDEQWGVDSINSRVLVQALEDGHPLINGAGGHATVVTRVSYYPTPYGPFITSVGVFDPWPGVGARALTPAELRPWPKGTLKFIALPVIS